MDSSLIVDSPERALLRQAVGQLVGGYGHAYFADCATRHVEPTELWKDLGAAGFLGVHLCAEYGGGGGTMTDLAVAIEETATQGCPLLMSVISPAICGTILDKHGSHEMKSHWLPGIADGSLKMAFAITEPDAGSNSHLVTTTAHPSGDGWRVSGTKYWTSAIDEADGVLVVARRPEPEPNGKHALSLFVVPTDAPGLSWTPIPSALSQPEHQFTVFFDDVAIGPEALIGVEGQGLRQVFAGLNPERITAACISNGIARYALNKAVRYACERQVWNTPIGAHQGVSHPLAECYIGTQVARLTTYRAAELYDLGLEAGEASNIAKFVSADSSLRTLDQAMQTHGGNGMSLEYGLADLWFVARMLKTAPVSREMVLNFVAQHSLKLPASY
ncbi:acyl-CoA dehydrogenase family protein [Sporichthya sp.]|uniref:acyl-CoA dehydrogenase family protein n=1 Tax=Sporichthya sp. TaxID=65475 RepID=UPI0018511D7E|nr:acyl-CoA dehydrogenase family protein [Sporichthya sp.]MBA3741882.1 acyl-CoA/acyl-ACP dehydrogenase [Sporichthya sp.]